MENEKLVLNLAKAMIQVWQNYTEEEQVSLKVSSVVELQKIIDNSADQDNVDEATSLKTQIEGL